MSKANPGKLEQILKAESVVGIATCGHRVEITTKSPKRLRRVRLIATRPCKACRDKLKPACLPMIRPPRPEAEDESGAA